MVLMMMMMMMIMFVCNYRCVVDEIKCAGRDDWFVDHKRELWLNYAP